MHLQLLVSMTDLDNNVIHKPCDSFILLEIAQMENPFYVVRPGSCEEQAEENREKRDEMPAAD